MTPLGHAEAHERLADLALEPGAFERLGPATSDPLTAHVETCAVCRAEVDAWRRTAARLEDARGTGPDRLDLADLAGGVATPAPPELRAAVLRAARQSGRAGAAGAAAEETTPIALVPAVAPSGDLPRLEPAARERRVGRLARIVLPLVAVLAVAVVGGSLLADQATRIDRMQSDIALLEDFAATADRVLREAEHRVVDLRGADGRISGSVSWSSHDLVVVTTALEPPPPGRIYRCWLERDGRRSPVGVMWFAGDVAFWNGSLEWATISFDDGGTFGVSLEPLDGPVGNPAVLVADLDE